MPDKPNRNLQKNQYGYRKSKSIFRKAPLREYMAVSISKTVLFCETVYLHKNGFGYLCKLAKSKGSVKPFMLFRGVAYR